MNHYLLWTKLVLSTCQREYSTTTHSRVKNMYNESLPYNWTKFTLSTCQREYTTKTQSQVKNMYNESLPSLN